MRHERLGNIPRKQRSPLRVGLSSGLFVAAAILLALVSKRINIDQRLFIMTLLVLVGLFIFAQVVMRNPKNKRDMEDEAKSCTPILESYRKRKSVDKLMSDYALWKEGEHSTYTRMHFAENIIHELQDAEEYERALEVLYEVGQLPLKGREHYDYDKFRNVCEAQLLQAIADKKV